MFDNIKVCNNDSCMYTTVHCLDTDTKYYVNWNSGKTCATSGEYWQRFIKAF